MPHWGQILFQDAASSVMMQLISFHDHTLIILTLVLTVVGYALTILMLNKYVNRYILEAQTIETVWTVLPALILLVLALPSLRILYITDEVSNPALTVKTIGHQWYWSYEYTDFMSVEMDSYMVQPADLMPGDFRLLEVDNRIVVPMKLEVRMLITAADVLHSWTIPSLGVKVDAVPGRLNQIGFTTSHPGVFYGQCSEICGANHSFMPIAMEVVDSKSFMKWISSFNS
uniref:Cytochrome c oxidase subunit 2 n=1 Tax=Amynthas hupeiensis TaxID=408830 RepID=A0A075D6V9_9ANNE|nr:cytochrome c oxidase subunit II [Amynthas hupeiensis]QED22312.1 cytochrome c oxidase subunit II [Amynthas sp. ZJ201510-02]QED22380.1 cytochrome c oxidase subunit II [Amynthas sp. HK201601-23]QFZ89466.1 cytochrome oxidase subunit II [Aporrectodea trapezoides]AHG94107.1 cytochrome oxidase subunit II [Amynthas hupeiensis]AMO26945.1 cytochrome c oxidase subunit II [Amynthas hupeiensis]